jgi:hypothetical protein
MGCRIPVARRSALPVRLVSIPSAALRRLPARADARAHYQIKTNCLFITIR